MVVSTIYTLDIVQISRNINKFPRNNMHFNTLYGNTFVAAITLFTISCSNSVEEVSKIPAEIQPLATTASYSSGIYQAISVELTCTSLSGKACSIYFQMQAGEQEPTSPQQYNNSIPFSSNGTTTLIFWGGR